MGQASACHREVVDSTRWFLESACATTKRRIMSGGNLEATMERAIPILPTDDLAAAKAFYVDGLGFQITFEASEDGRAGLLGVARGTIELTLDSPMNGHGRNACVS